MNFLTCVALITYKQESCQCQGEFLVLNRLLLWLIILVTNSFPKPSSPLLNIFQSATTSKMVQCLLFLLSVVDEPFNSQKIVKVMSSVSLWVALYLHL